jgi:DNA-binding HxlR family transcriptional regulator
MLRAVGNYWKVGTQKCLGEGSVTMTTRTAADRRDEDQRTYNVFVAECPTRRVMATVGDKWTALVMCGLSTGSKRHSELRDRIAGVSQKMLTQTLRTLERDGLLTRTVTAAVPVRVDYELTELGRSLVPVLEGLRIWSESNIELILDARDAFDTARATG